MKGPEALYFLGKSFTSRYGHPSNALIALPLTAKWLSSAREGKDEEWNEHKSSLSELTRRNEISPSFLPSTTLRTGGSSSVKIGGNQADISSTLNATNFIGWYLHLEYARLSCFLNLSLSSIWSKLSQVFLTHPFFDPETIDPHLECKGEEIDLLVRLGLLKLVSRITGLAESELPETMNLNFSRLRSVQSQVQKIIVKATR